MAEFGLRFGLLFQIADDLADHDVRVDSGVDLQAMAEENAAAARACLQALAPSRFRDALFDLVELVADGARRRP
jgi:geranylgeranyl pyrophosphate synthase